MAEAAQIGMQANVLLVEDEPLIGDAVAQALEEQGFAVETVLSAEEAVCRLTDGASIDLLFTDLYLREAWMVRHWRGGRAKCGPICR